MDKVLVKLIELEKCLENFSSIDYDNLYKTFLDANKRKSSTEELKELARGKPFNIEDIKINSRKLENYSFSNMPKSSIIDRVLCKLFGHKKFIEYNYYKDTKKDEHITEYRCQRCGYK